MTSQQETALYRDLAAELRCAIVSGEAVGGLQLATEAELADEHGISRNTVRLALPSSRPPG